MLLSQIWKQRSHELTDLCSEHEEELDELRTLRRNVLASMGLESQKPLDTRPSSQSSSQTTNRRSLREPRKHRRRTSTFHAGGAGLNDAIEFPDIPATMPGDGFPEPFASQESVEAVDIVTQSKHMRPQQTVMIPKLQAPHAQNLALESNLISSLRRSSPKKRTALGQISPNRPAHDSGFHASCEGGPSR